MITSSGDIETAICDCIGIDQEIVETRIYTAQVAETGLGTDEDPGKETL